MEGGGGWSVSWGWEIIWKGAVGGVKFDRL